MGVAAPNLCSAYGDTSQACVSETVASTCRALAATGCVQLIVAKSCPVQLSCLRSVCPATGPAPNTACSANGLECTFQTYTCPGTSTPITTSWAECYEGSWQIAEAKIVCPKPEPEPEPAVNVGAIAGGVIGGCAVLVIAILAWYVTVFRRTRQKTPAATPEYAPDIKLSKAGSKA